MLNLFSRATLMWCLRLIEIPAVCFVLMLPCWPAASIGATHGLDRTCPPGHLRTSKGCFNCSECPFISAIECAACEIPTVDKDSIIADDSREMDSKCPPGFFKALGSCVNCSVCAEISISECEECEIPTGDKDSIIAVAGREMDTKCPPGFFKALGTCKDCSVCAEISAKECKECEIPTVDKNSITVAASREMDTKCPPGFFKALGTCMDCSVCAEISAKECKECVTTPLPMKSTQAGSYTATKRESEIVTNKVNVTHKSFLENISTVLPTQDDVGNSDLSDIALYLCTAIMVAFGMLALVLLYRHYEKKRRPQCARCLTNHGQPTHQSQGCMFHNVNGGIVTLTSRVTHNPTQPKEDDAASSSTSDGNVDELRCHSFPSVMEAGTNRQYQQCSGETSV